MAERIVKPNEVIHLRELLDHLADGGRVVFEPGEEVAPSRTPRSEKRFHPVRRTSRSKPRTEASQDSDHGIRGKWGGFDRTVFGQAQK